MPWNDLRTITQDDLLEFLQPSGDRIYALPFTKIIENFEYLKTRLYVGHGSPNFFPEQDKAVYYDIQNKNIYVWANYNWVLMFDISNFQTLLNNNLIFSFFMGE